MSETARLSQKTAILLERARQAGVSEDTLLESVATGDTTLLKEAEAEHYRYDSFVSYAAEHGEQLERAIREGYRITFNTFNGLQLWLEQTFKIERGVDFTATEGKLSGLKLSSSNADRLQNTLAFNWVMKAEESDGEQLVTLTIRGME
jgi:hypothetical protein